MRVKRYDPRGLRKPFKHPVWGRVLLFVLLIFFPVIWPAAYLWQNRKEFFDEAGELIQAVFLPREDPYGD